MKNCHADILAYHDEHVTLPNNERTAMRERRDSNRRRLKQGLRRDDEPKPVDCRSQGSYAMRTMVQHIDKDYDVDDGVYFCVEQLKGSRGGDRSPANIKEMVRKALHDERFERPPEKLKHCVRVYYNAGYHVDIPIYRQIVEQNLRGEDEIRTELASTHWKTSDPLAVTEWFQDANKEKSPDSNNGGQLRRVVRLLKAFARSRPSWRKQIATGFMITKLVVDRFSANGEREDWALHDTMAAIRDQLNWSLEIKHPTIEGEMLTKGSDDSQTRFLRDKLSRAIEQLDVLSRWNCSREQALKAWDRVFDTEFFVKRLEVSGTESGERQGSGGPFKVSGASATSGFLIKRSEEAAAKKPVDKRGSGRYA